MTQKVLIAGAIRQRPEILALFLTALKNLDLSGLEVEYFLIDDNDDPIAVDLLRNFAPVQSGRGKLQTVHTFDTYLPHVWTKPLINKVAGFHDCIINYARRHDFNVLMVDTDLVLHPTTLQQLIATGKDLVGELYYYNLPCQNADQRNPLTLPPVWLGDPDQHFHSSRGEDLSEAEQRYRSVNFREQLNSPGLYEVGGVRGCIYISQTAIQAGVSYRVNEYLNLPRAADYLAINAGSLGIQPYVDTHFPAYHLGSPEDLPQRDDLRQSPAIPAKPSLKTLYWKQEAKTPGEQRQIHRVNPQLTLMVLVQNDDLQLLKKTLMQAKSSINRAIVLDLAHHSELAELCREMLPGIQCDIHPDPAGDATNINPNYYRELWKITVATAPEWLLLLQPGEVLAEQGVKQLPTLLANPGLDHYAFPVFDFWNATHFREDPLWQTHLTPQIRLVRFQPNFDYQWSRPGNSNYFPDNIPATLGTLSNLRLKNYRWATPEDRLSRFEQYRCQGPDPSYEVTARYQSLFASAPRLVQWFES